MVALNNADPAVLMLSRYTIVIVRWHCSDTSWSDRLTEALSPYPVESVGLLHIPADIVAAALMT